MTVVMEPPAPAAPPAVRPRRRRRLVALVALVAVVVGLLWWNSRTDDVRAGTALVTTEGLAAEHGIDVDLIAVTAAGGLVEFRYQVIDPDKATRILHETELAPILVAEETGQTLMMSSPPHKHGGELQLGGTYFFLLANSGNALHRGTQVTLVVGDVRVEHLTVQG